MAKSKFDKFHSKQVEKFASKNGKQKGPKPKHVPLNCDLGSNDHHAAYTVMAKDLAPGGWVEGWVQKQKQVLTTINGKLVTSVYQGKDGAWVTVTGKGKVVDGNQPEQGAEPEYVDNGGYLVGQKDLGGGFVATGLTTSTAKSAYPGDDHLNWILKAHTGDLSEVPTGVVLIDNVQAFFTPSFGGDTVETSAVVHVGATGATFSGFKFSPGGVFQVTMVGDMLKGVEGLGGAAFCPEGMVPKWAKPDKSWYMPSEQQVENTITDLVSNLTVYMDSVVPNPSAPNPLVETPANDGKHPHFEYDDKINKYIKWELNSDGTMSKRYVLQSEVVKWAAEQSEIDNDVPPPVPTMGAVAKMRTIGRDADQFLAGMTIWDDSGVIAIGEDVLVEVEPYLQFIHNTFTKVTMSVAAQRATYMIDVLGANSWDGLWLSDNHDPADMLGCGVLYPAPPEEYDGSTKHVVASVLNPPCFTLWPGLDQLPMADEDGDETQFPLASDATLDPEVIADEEAEYAELKKAEKAEFMGNMTAQMNQLSKILSEKMLGDIIKKVAFNQAVHDAFPSANNTSTVQGALEALAPIGDPVTKALKDLENHVVTSYKPQSYAPGAASKGIPIKSQGVVKKYGEPSYLQATNLVNNVLEFAENYMMGKFNKLKKKAEPVKVGVSPGGDPFYSTNKKAQKAFNKINDSMTKAGSAPHFIVKDFEQVAKAAIDPTLDIFMAFLQGQQDTAVVLSEVKFTTDPKFGTIHVRVDGHLLVGDSSMSAQNCIKAEDVDSIGPGALSWLVAVVYHDLVRGLVDADKNVFEWYPS